MEKLFIPFKRGSHLFITRGSGGPINDVIIYRGADEFEGLFGSKTSASVYAILFSAFSRASGTARVSGALLVFARLRSFTTVEAISARTARSPQVGYAVSNLGLLRGLRNNRDVCELTVVGASHRIKADKVQRI
jgi:hypothetical protein